MIWILPKKFALIGASSINYLVGCNSRIGEMESSSHKDNT
jgi:hypothetical protein